MDKKNQYIVSTSQAELVSNFDRFNLLNVINLENRVIFLTIKVKSLFFFSACDFLANTVHLLLMWSFSSLMLKHFITYGPHKHLLKSASCNRSLHWIQKSHGSFFLGYRMFLSISCPYPFNSTTSSYPFILTQWHIILL